MDARWTTAWGEDVVVAAGQLIAELPPLDLTLADPAATAEWTERLGGVSLAPGHVRLDAGARVIDLPGYEEGAWWVQDFAAALPARLLGAAAGPDEDVLDLCAAPGGKTLQLAAAGWAVTAADVSESRLARLSVQPRPHRPGRQDPGQGRAEMGPAAALRRGPARRTVQRDRHLPPPSRRARSAPTPR